MNAKVVLYITVLYVTLMVRKGRCVFKSLKKNYK